MAVAEELRVEVEAARGRRRTWRKVTTVLDLFGVYRLTDAVRSRIDEALTAGGLRSEPTFATAGRSDSVRLYLIEEQDGGVLTGQANPALEGVGQLSHPKHPRSPGTSDSASGGARLTTSPSIHVKRWPAGGHPIPLSQGQSYVPSGRESLWADVSGSDSSIDVHSRLAPVCPGLTLDMVENLMHVDDRPGVHPLEAINGGRRISAFAAFAVESDRGVETGEPESEIAGVIVFQMVELLACNDWIVSCWHDPIAYRGAHAIDVDPGDPLVASRLVHRDSVESEIISDWLADERIRTTGDLGSLILRELTRTFAPARRELHAWLESWELAFYHRDDTVEKRTLVELRSLVAEFRRRLAELNQPGVKDKDAWFLGLGAPEIAELIDSYIDRGLRDLRELQESIRSGFDLVSSREATKQLQLAQDQQARSKGLQSTLEIGAAVLLVPTLVAGIYGANTAIPGGGTWGGFGGMLLVMIVSTLLALLGINRLRRRHGGE